ncbi:MAG TPA: hypothetical protein VJG83_01480, partial [archaeon]|nr:hypothetical protein [archaeon]
NKVIYADDSIEVEGGIVVQRFLIWRLVRAGAGATASYFSFFVNIKNTSTNDYGAVTIREDVPADISTQIKRLTFYPEPDNILSSEPPSFEWRLENFAAGSDVNMLYIMNGISNKNVFINIDAFESYFKAIPDPQALIEKKDPLTCTEISCDDLNVCTQDSCENAVCSHTPRNGVSCGANMVCEDSQCVKKDDTTVGAIVLPQIDLPNETEFVTAGIVITVLVAWALSTLFFLLYRKKKNAPWKP